MSVFSGVFSLIRERTTEKIGYKNFRHFCSHFGHMSERFIIIESKWCLVLYTYWLNPWQSPSWEADQSSQLNKKYPAFYGTRRFFTVLTSASHPSLFWANSIQSARTHPVSWTSILILSSHLRLGLPNGLFHSGFPTNTLCTPLSSPIRATCHGHLILLDLTTRTILGKDTDHSAPHYVTFSIPLSPRPS
jgi:hypothetical protein